MALSQASLQKRIEEALKAQGIKIEGEHAQAIKIAIAVSTAVVAEITENAQVIVTGGSSAGTYKVH